MVSYVRIAPYLWLASAYVCEDWIFCEMFERNTYGVCVFVSVFSRTEHTLLKPTEDWVSRTTHVRFNDSFDREANSSDTFCLNMNDGLCCVWALYKCQKAQNKKHSHSEEGKVSENARLYTTRNQHRHKLKVNLLKWFSVSTSLYIKNDFIPLRLKTEWRSIWFLPTISTNFKL